jgi:hypothetical protein
MVPSMLQSVRSWRWGQAILGLAVVLVLAAAIVAATAGPAAALDLFARHTVTVEFATHDGKPMANAEVRVFAPGHFDKPAQTGRTDKDGKFEFAADSDGMWSAEAHTGDEIGRVSIRVGAPATEQNEPVSPVWVIGGLLVLLILVFAYRIARRRLRRRKKT